MVGGLADKTVEGWDREVDPIPEPVSAPSLVIEELEHDTNDDDESDMHVAEENDENIANDEDDD